MQFASAQPTPAPVEPTPGPMSGSELPFAHARSIVQRHDRVIAFELDISKSNEPLLGGSDKIPGLRKIRRATAAALDVDGDHLDVSFVTAQPSVWRRLGEDYYVVLVKVAVRGPAELELVEFSVYESTFAPTLQRYMNTEGIQGRVLVHPKFSRPSIGTCLPRCYP